MVKKENNRPAICKSIFKNGESQISKSYFTKFYVEFINQLEKSKHTVTGKY